MEFLHSELDLKSGDVVEVTLDSQANVLLLDPSNFAYYKRGEAYRYYRGLAEKSPVHLASPHPGKWNLVVNLGGYAGSVRAGIRVIQAQEAAR